MDLYIANTSTQDHMFLWTMPENVKIFHMPIKAGSQALVLNGVSEFEFDYVVNHHRQYGLMSVSEAKAFSKQERPIALVYDTKPLAADIYGMVQDANEDIIAKNIQLEKELTAASMINAVKNNPELNENVKSVELEIEEMVPREFDRKDKDLVKQKFSSEQQ